MLPDELLARCRWRQIKQLSRHLQRRWNQPSRSDHYVMQLTARVANMVRKKGGQAIKTQDMKITWKFGDRKLDFETMEKMGKAVWLGAVAAVGPGLVDSRTGERMSAAQIREATGLKLYDPWADNDEAPRDDQGDRIGERIGA